MSNRSNIRIILSNTFAYSAVADNGKKILPAEELEIVQKRFSSLEHTISKIGNIEFISNYAGGIKYGEEIHLVGGSEVETKSGEAPDWGKTDIRIHLNEGATPEDMLKGIRSHLERAGAEIISTRDDLPNSSFVLPHRGLDGKNILMHAHFSW